MRKRLRKKKRLGEFTEFGFELVADLRPATAAAVDAFIDRLIDAVEARKLGVSGGFGVEGGNTFDGIVRRLGRGSANEGDRAALSAFLESDVAVVRHEIGPLIDIWR